MLKYVKKESYEKAIWIWKQGTMIVVNCMMLICVSCWNKWKKIEKNVKKSFSDFMVGCFREFLLCIIDLVVNTNAKLYI